MTDHQIDWRMPHHAGHHHPLDPAELAERERELADFVADVRRAWAAGVNAADPNQVEVQPGGKVFATIGEALASITDASQKKQYMVYVGAGTFNEVVVCKSWVFLQGAGLDQTFVTAPAAPASTSMGTIIGASNSAVQNMTVQSTTTGKGGWAAAVACAKATNFDIENCALIARDDQGAGAAMGLAVDYVGGASGSVVYVAYTSILAAGVDGKLPPVGFIGRAKSFVQLTESKVEAQGTPPSWGGGSGSSSNVVLYNCRVEGGAYSLQLIDTMATCTANQCELVGPVGGSVVVNP
jgi:hypothetical protein